MAKGTSFAAKAKGKKKKSQTLVKYIKSVKSDKTGHWRFNEQMIALDDSENFDAALQRLKDETFVLDMELPNPEGDADAVVDEAAEVVEEEIKEEATVEEESSEDEVEEKPSDETEEKAEEATETEVEDIDPKEAADKEEKAEDSE